MPDTDAAYLTTRELADLLRIGERKVYDLAANGDVPCVRVVGKLLFPKDKVLNWIEAGRSGPEADVAPLPSVVVGSHDPLLDWALRESGSGLAAFFDGSHDGLTRFMEREALACAMHVHEADDWNVGTVSARAGHLPVVLVGFARRSRGLIVAKDNPLGIKTLGDLSEVRVARRQSTAASQRLLTELAIEDGVDIATLPGPDAPARTEDDVALNVFDGQADVAFGLEAVAHQFRLGFVPILDEGFDLLVWRQAWFEPAFQKFLAFLLGESFERRAGSLPGYDLAPLGQVRLNGSCR